MPDPFRTNDPGPDRPWLSGLRSKIGLVIVVVAAAICAGTGAWDLYRVRQRETRLLEQAAPHLAQNLASYLALPMWEMDSRGVEVILATALQRPEIQAVWVREDVGGPGNQTLLAGMARQGDALVPAGEADISAPYTAEAPVAMALENGERRRLGSVTVQLTPEPTEEFLAQVMVEVGIKTFFALVLLALILYCALSKLVIGPVTRIMRGLEQVRGGDLDAVIEEGGTDELGMLARSFNSMTAILKNYSESLGRSSGHIAEASARIEGAAAELAQGAESQLTQVLETSKGMENMHASISEVSESAEKTSKRAGEASNLARDGSVKVTRTVEGFNAANAVIKELNQRSQEIEQVVQLIGDIASQTNILALNAAIEAARAGEYGRGFDVVAEEIRKLAQRTTQSTGEISDMIAEILHKTEQAATLMEKGSVWANSAGKALDDIVDGIVATSDMVDIISSVAAMQATTAQSIATSLQDISEVSRKSAQTSGSVAASASELAGLAERLSEDADWAGREAKENADEPRPWTGDPDEVE